MSKFNHRSNPSKPIILFQYFLLIVVSGAFVFTGCERRHKKTTGDRHFSHDGCYTFETAKPNQHYPIILYRHDSFPQEYAPALEKAISAWEAGTRKKLFQLSTEVISTAAIPTEPDGKYVIYWQKEWSTNPSEIEQGRTYIYENNEVIVEADILINASMKDFSFFLDTPNNANEVHLESVFIHELGHVLGLEHTLSQTSVMYTHLKANDVRNQIPDEDLNKLKCFF